MKKTIKLAALVLLAGVTFVTVAAAKSTSPASDEITFSSLPSLKGIAIKVESAQPSKAVVTVYNADKNVIFKDGLPAYKAMEKGYILDQLDYGDYTIVVRENKSEVKKSIHVYDQDGVKTFIMIQ